jgi:two-component system CheB/CheR fusion protein
MKTSRSAASHSRPTDIIKLIFGDAGRPVTDLVSNLDYPELAENAREVLRPLVPIERQVETSNARWFVVRIMPYRTQENRIDGVVITFVNLTQAKVEEALLAEALTALKSRFEAQGENWTNYKMRKLRRRKRKPCWSNWLRNNARSWAGE